MISFLCQELFLLLSLCVGLCHRPFTALNTTHSSVQQDDGENAELEQDAPAPSSLHYAAHTHTGKESESSMVVVDSASFFMNENFQTATTMTSTNSREDEKKNRDPDTHSTIIAFSDIDSSSYSLRIALHTSGHSDSIV